MRALPQIHRAQTDAARAEADRGLRKDGEDDQRRPHVLRLPVQCAAAFEDTEDFPEKLSGKDDATR